MGETKHFINNIGDVILDDGKPMVVVDIILYKDTGSCGYDRQYLLVDEEWLRDNQTSLLSQADLEEHGRWMYVTGAYIPDVKSADVAPYAIKQEKCYKVRQKIAKTVTVYV